MLTRELRDIIVDDIADMDFTVDGVDYGVDVFRMDEGFRADDLPFILVKFLPANKPKFESISDAVGYATEDRAYIQYQKCQLELISIHCYTRDIHKIDEVNQLNGRSLCAELMQKILNHVLSKWDALLNPYHVYRDRQERLNIQDKGKFRVKAGTRVYEYDLDVYLRTNLAWDKVPEDYEEGSTLINELGVTLKKDEKSQYINIKYS